MSVNIDQNSLFDDTSIVSIGTLEQGFQFFGPFETSELAQKFIEEVVSPNLKADWHYLDEPYEKLKIINGTVIDSEFIEVDDVEKDVLTLPPETPILNKKGKLIGVQTVIDG
jgi:hypothetical protein